MRGSQTEKKAGRKVERRKKGNISGREVRRERGKRTEKEGKAGKKDK
jgi:hypothetical protein